jgi:hypothetical protein
MDRTTDLSKYVWKEHVTPSVSSIAIQDEDTEMQQQHIEEFNEQEPRKISTEEAERKQFLMKQVHFGHEQSTEPEIDENNTMVNTLFDEEDGTGDSLIEIISDLDDTNSTMEYAVQEGAEEQIVNKLEKIGLLTRKQGTYLANISQRFTKELGYLIEHYKKEKARAIEKLAIEQQARITVEEDYKRCVSRVEKLELILNNNDNSKTTLEEKLQQTLKQVERLENIVQAEQELRKQADLRTKEILNKAKKFKDLCDSEKKQKEIAEQQAQKAVHRAREVMSYFFNSAFVEDSMGRNAMAGLFNNNFPEFDSMMFSKKSFF